MAGVAAVFLVHAAFWIGILTWAHVQSAKPVDDGPRMVCPGCKRALPVDSVRRHVTGARRLYWECSDCRLSIMRRP